MSQIMRRPVVSDHRNNVALCQTPFRPEEDFIFCLVKQNCPLSPMKVGLVAANRQTAEKNNLFPEGKCLKNRIRVRIQSQGEFMWGKRRIRGYTPNINKDML